MTTSTASLSLTASRVLSGLLPVVGLAPWLAGQILYPSDDSGWQAALMTPPQFNPGEEGAYAINLARASRAVKRITGQRLGEVFPARIVDFAGQARHEVFADRQPARPAGALGWAAQSV